MNILIIDDDNSLAKGLRKLFRLHGNEVVSHEGGDDMLAVAKRESPDVVLLDVDLGDKDGRDWCLPIKQATGAKQVPVLLMSGRSDGNDDMARACGADAFVAKPFSVLHLLSRMRQLVRAAT